MKINNSTNHLDLWRLHSHSNAYVCARCVQYNWRVDTNHVCPLAQYITDYLPNPVVQDVFSYLNAVDCWSKLPSPLLASLQNFNLKIDACLNWQCQSFPTIIPICWMFLFVARDWDFRKLNQMLFSHEMDRVKTGKKYS